MGIEFCSLLAGDWRINMAEELLQVRNLQVNVEDKQILHSIDLDIKLGETLSHTCIPLFLQVGFLNGGSSCT